MTAIYGFLSPEYRRAVLLADDLEGNSHRQVAKVYRLGARFICGIHGSDLTNPILTILGARIARELENPQTFGSIIDCVANALPVVARCIWNPYSSLRTSGAIPDAAWREVMSNPVCLVLMDGETFTGVDVNFGLPFPPQGTHIPVVTPLSPNVLLRFALANQSQPGEIDYRTAPIQEVIADFDTRIHLDHIAGPTRVGLPGTFSYLSGNIWNSRVLYTTTQAEIEAAYGFEHLGFILNVYPA